MTSGRSTIDAKFVLKRDNLDLLMFRKSAAPPVGIEFLFLDLETNLWRVVIAFGPVINGADNAGACGKSVAMASQMSVVNVATPHCLGR